RRVALRECSSAEPQALKRAEEAALKTYRELLKAPGMTEPALAAMLLKLCSDEASKGEPVAKLIDRAQHGVMTQVMCRWLNKRSPQSMLCTSARALAGGRDMPESVLGDIAHDIARALPLDVETLAVALRCDARADKILEALQPILKQSIDTRIKSWLGRPAK